MANVSGEGASVLWEWTCNLMAKIVVCQKKERKNLTSVTLSLI
jgi:hypothetical protein